MLQTLSRGTLESVPRYPHVSPRRIQPRAFWNTVRSLYLQQRPVGRHHLCTHGPNRVSDFHLDSRTELSRRCDVPGVQLSSSWTFGAPGVSRLLTLRGGVGDGEGASPALQTVTPVPNIPAVGSMGSDGHSYVFVPGATRSKRDGVMLCVPPHNYSGSPLRHLTGATYSCAPVR